MLSNSQQFTKDALQRKAKDFIKEAQRWNDDATYDDKELNSYCTQRALLCLKTAELYLDASEQIK